MKYLRFAPVLIGLLCAVPAFAGGAKESQPFSLSAGIEQVWSKLDIPEHHGTKQYDTDTQVNLLPSFELRENIYLTGRVSYPIRSELPQFALGISFKVY